MRRERLLGYVKEKSMNNEFIDYALKYARDDIDKTYELWTKMNPHISKGEEFMKMDRTVSEVFNTLNEQQRTAVYKIVGEAIHTNFCCPKIKDVIFNDPAIIVFWTDGTKTVVKCQEGDIFDPEKGLTMAIAKKVYGNKGSYCNVIKKWCEPYHEKHNGEYDGYSNAITKAVYEKLSTICDAFTEKYGRKESDKTDRKYEIVYETRADAEKVLNGMSEIIDEYGFVTVADLYDISGLPGAYYTDSKIGWKGSIKEPTVKRVRSGYIIDLPEPEVLE
jgi:hypothetical protein